MESSNFVVGDNAGGSSRSLTLDELLPPIEPPTPPHKRHRRAIIIGAVVIALFTVAGIVAATDKGSVRQAKIGDCIDLTVVPYATINEAKFSNCSKPHTAEVFAIGTTTKAISLSGDALDPEVLRICVTEIDPKLRQVLVQADNQAAFGVLVGPSRTGLVVCVANTPERVGSFVSDAHLTP